MENVKPFYIKKETAVTEPYFELNISNGLKIFSIIPLRDRGEESICIIENPSITIDIENIDSIEYINHCLKEHFKYVLKTYHKYFPYPYSIEYIIKVIRNI